MLNRTIILATAAAIAIAVGVAASLFELTVLGVIAAIVAVALGLKGRTTREAPGR
jgi:hypothetical protein